MPCQQAAHKNGSPGSVPTRRTQERKSLSGRTGTVVVVVVVVVVVERSRQERILRRKEYSAGTHFDFIPKHTR